MREALSKSGKRAVNQPRIARAQDRIVDTQPLRDAGTIALDYAVASIREPQNDFSALISSKIECERPLTAVKREVLAGERAAFL